jgi:hypothetical protein
LRNDNALTAYVYDIASHSVALSQAIGTFDLATDNAETMPEPKWSQSCDVASFDPGPTGKPAFQLKLNSAEMQWKAFLAQPSVSTYQPLSAAIRTCAATKCHDAAVSGSEDNFANLYKLLGLTEHGNHYAMEIAFQMRPLYENAAAPSEDINNSLGLSATRESRFFLELIRKYDIPAETLETLAVQTSRESIDNIRAQRNELRSRIESLLKVTDPGLLQLRDKTISLIQLWLDKYSTLPDDAGAK